MGLEKKLTPLIFLAIGAIVFLFYLPSLTLPFLADDYDYVFFLWRDARTYLQGHALDYWFITYYGGTFFRPVLQWIWLIEFSWWHTNPLGYHLFNLLLHTANSSLVYLIALRITRQRWIALASGLLFVLHPMHADSVTWISDLTDIFSAFFFLLALVFYLLYRQQHRSFFLGVSLFAYAAAIGTKENTIGLPAIFLAHDLLFIFPERRWKIFRAHIPFVIFLIIYAVARWLSFGGWGGYREMPIILSNPVFFFQYYATAFWLPFLATLDPEYVAALFLDVAVLIFILRKNKSVWFGLACTLIPLVPAALTLGAGPRLVYTPSAGVVIAICAALGAIATHPTPLRRMTQIGILILIVVLYASALTARLSDWSAAGDVATSVIQETVRLRPRIDPETRFYYVGVPDALRNVYIYADNFPNAIRLTYKNPELKVENGSRFPIISDGLSNAVFLEYNRRRLIERSDVLSALQARHLCFGVSSVITTFDFSRGAEGWQPRSDLAPFEMRDQTLSTRAIAAYPSMTSPPISISSLSISAIEIRMRVRAEIPETHAAIFWLVQGQEDYLPEQPVGFQVKPDGVMQTYRVDVGGSDALYFGEKITRLRLDPAATFAQIEIESIKIFAHCSSQTNAPCECAK